MVLSAGTHRFYLNASHLNVYIHIYMCTKRHHWHHQNSSGAYSTNKIVHMTLYRWDQTIYRYFLKRIVFIDTQHISSPKKIHKYFSKSYFIIIFWEYFSCIFTRKISSNRFECFHKFLITFYLFHFCLLCVWIGS